MEDVEELPTWAARTHVPGSNFGVEELPPKRRRPWRPVLVVLLALLGLGAVAALGYLAAGLGTGDDTATADDAAEDAADPANGVEPAGTDASDSEVASDGAASGDTETDTAASAGDGDPTGTDAGTSDGAASETDPATAGGEPGETDLEAARGEPVDNSDGSVRYAVLKGGQLFLRGRVHSEEYGKRIEEVALGVMGPGNVINEYEIDPTTPEVTGGPVYVEDVVLFEFNSIEVAPPFLPILDLGTALMAQNPTVEITVVSRTDAVGSEAVNLEVSEQRAQAVVNYWASQGVDTSRVTIDARGEEEASSGADQAEAALDRRVEFIINNLFG